jgi:hypothetical protein
MNSKIIKFIVFMLALLVAGVGLYYVSQENNSPNKPSPLYNIEDVDDIRYGYLRNQDVSLNGIYSDETRVLRPIQGQGHLNPRAAAKYYVDYHRNKNQNLQALYESNKIMYSRKVLRATPDNVGRLPRLNNPNSFPNYKGVPTVTYEYDDDIYPLDTNYNTFDDTFGTSNDITKHEYIWPSSLYDGLPWAPEGQLYNSLRTNHYREVDHHRPKPKTKKKVKFQGVSEF